MILPGYHNYDNAIPSLHAQMPGCCQLVRFQMELSRFGWTTLGAEEQKHDWSAVLAIHLGVTTATIVKMWA